MLREPKKQVDTLYIHNSCGGSCGRLSYSIRQFFVAVTVKYINHNIIQEGIIYTIGIL